MSSTPPNPMPQSNPWSSQRLHYRAIRPNDINVFHAFSADYTGFANSNFDNIKLPSPSDSEKFMKGVQSDCLMGAIIWLPHPPQTSSMSDEEREKEFAQRRRNGEVVDEEYGTAVGEIHMDMLPAHKQHHRNTEIGLDILPPYQGRGYGSEAIRWALDYAFRRAGLHRVKVRGFSWNEGALRLYEKLGFVFEGRERESVWHEGKWWDVVTLGMLEGEWRATRE
ncbi:acyl-CoA N-acyltransferase [Alternaria rosae]|uniref:acyl-CoA N-acyltransferase n=1 Tax=Alternaria rosae TaxID=1187941 RepID=UPI001E8D65D8|nr:acyl-CoA N-acyltransferase [Alternaria rosae]KAH6870112.1 acyl-CoA N-acyltransferase [Alternaria rosae]